MFLLINCHSACIEAAENERLYNRLLCANKNARVCRKHVEISIHIDTSRDGIQGGMILMY